MRHFFQPFLLIQFEKRRELQESLSLMQIKALKNSFENVLLEKKAIFEEDVKKRIFVEKRIERVVRFNKNVETWHQRLFLGVAAISSQPFYDYFNRNVDQDTRKYSAARTVAKIIVGTSEGCLVRFLAVRYGKKIAFNCLNNKNDVVVEKLKEFLEKRSKEFKEKFELGGENAQEYKSSAIKFNRYKDKLNDWIDEVREHVKNGGNFNNFTFESDKTKDLEQYLKESGNVLSVGAAFLAGLMIDIPMTNKVLNWGMDIFFPGHCQKNIGGSK